MCMHDHSRIHPSIHPSACVRYCACTSVPLPFPPSLVGIMHPRRSTRSQALTLTLTVRSRRCSENILCETTLCAHEVDLLPQLSMAQGTASN